MIKENWVHICNGSLKDQNCYTAMTVIQLNFRHTADSSDMNTQMQTQSWKNVPAESLFRGSCTQKETKKAKWKRKTNKASRRRMWEGKHLSPFSSWKCNQIHEYVYQSLTYTSNVLEQREVFMIDRATVKLQSHRGFFTNIRTECDSRIVSPTNRIQTVF